MAEKVTQSVEDWSDMGEAVVEAFARTTEQLVDPRVSNAAVGSLFRRHLRELGFDVVTRNVDRSEDQAAPHG